MKLKFWAKLVTGNFTKMWSSKQISYSDATFMDDGALGFWNK